MSTDFQIIEVSPADRFSLWYRHALIELEKMDKGNGSIAALMVVLPLYERYAQAEIDSSRATCIEDVLMSDLGFKSRKRAQRFWTVFRHGLCHAATFFTCTKDLKNLPFVHLDGDAPNLPEVIPGKKGGRAIITVNPWGFVRHVMSKYETDHSLFDRPDAPLLPLFYRVERKCFDAAQG